MRRVPRKAHSRREIESGSPVSPSISDTRVLPTAYLTVVLRAGYRSGTLKIRARARMFSPVDAALPRTTSLTSVEATSDS